MSEIIAIEGGHKLNGTVEISGAKNATVALIPAIILADSPVTIYGVPEISDVDALAVLLEELNCTVLRSHDSLIVDPSRMENVPLVSDAVDKLRASYYLMGALLGKCKKVVMKAPGGCFLGPRPIDLHIKGFEALGAKVEFVDGAHVITADRLVGAKIYLDFAKIRGAGTDTITIEGVEHLKGCTHEIIPDRIEAGTFLIMAAAAGERVIIQNIIPQHLESLISKLKEMGVKMENVGDSIIVYGDNKNFNAVDVRTQVYPGFATDLQQPLTALLTQANGQSQVIETIYPERFRHCEQLNKMGANIELDESMCYINGKTPLKGAKVEATDLRCGAALLIAGLIADGITEISNVYHIDRGYANIDQKLITLGAVIRRIKVDD